MTSGSSEQTIIENGFGIVTTKRITYRAQKSSWFIQTGRSREDIPLKQIASVRYDTDRKIFWGLFWIVLGLVFLESIIGIIPLIIGIFMLWGSPTVNVVTSGGTTTPVIGWPWQKKEAGAFVNALRGQLFSE